MNTKNKFIICIDSDGCAMDTMNYKHFDFFGPLAVKEWKIKNEKEFIRIWNRINLFSYTRGCNRFIGLKLTFEEYLKRFNEFNISDDFYNWINNTKQLSNASLEKAISETNSNDLKKILNWSIEVNKSIKNSNKEGEPFEGVVSAFNEIFKKTDIACVSSANKDAVIKEWESSGLLKLCKFVFTQEEGTKADCIKKLIQEFGYNERNILMIGDSYGDYDSTKINNVYFYPILFNKEEKSWNSFREIYLEKFINNSFSEVQEKLLSDFNINFENGIKNI